jgi:hypothetical protein
MNPTPQNLFFFLGGQDLEMQCIAKLLAQHAPGRFKDAHLGWGAKASSYKAALFEVLDCGYAPVLIELENDLPLQAHQIILVDHHGSRAGAGATTSLEQVFALLQLPKNLWTRELALVAANDRGWIPELQAIGATVAEISDIRRADRAAQGITELHERQAEAALAALRYLDAEQRFAVVELAHSKTAAVADRLHPALGHAQPELLLVQSPSETNFFGPGWVIMLLEQHFPGGWRGGALPEQGFWGIGRRVALDAELITSILAFHQP